MGSKNCGFTNDRGRLLGMIEGELKPLKGQNGETKVMKIEYVYCWVDQ